METVLYMTVIGNMICNMEMDLSNGTMDRDTKDNIKRVINMEEEIMFGVMDLNT